jgi:hypothetical protein
MSAILYPEQGGYEKNGRIYELQADLCRIFCHARPLELLSL